MNESAASLDLEFKRYLQIIRPYLTQLVDAEVIEICNNWIMRLSSCKNSEKADRNKYIFALCYQLAKGIITHPFIEAPPDDDLHYVDKEKKEQDSVPDVEYIGTEESGTKIIFNGNNLVNSDTEVYSQSHSNLYDGLQDEDEYPFTSKMSPRSNNGPKPQKKVLGFTSTWHDEANDVSKLYELRANNLVLKLRQIKRQNYLLQNELLALKQETKLKDEDKVHEVIEKINNATNTDIRKSNTNMQLNLLKEHLKESELTQNSMIMTINSLRHQLDSFNDMKAGEMDDIKARHEVDIVKVKNATREECKAIYEDKLEEQKNFYENKIKEILTKNENKINQDLKFREEVICQKEKIIEEKDKVIKEKEYEIASLKSQLDSQKNYMEMVISKLSDSSGDSDGAKLKTIDLEKRLHKLENSKLKYVSKYEAKIATLQKEKQMAETALQLYIAKQRTIGGEVVNDNQADLEAALDKLESKYKEIVASVQATAIQRRIQDQKTLESILNNAFGKQNANIIPVQNNLSLIAERVVKNRDVNQSCESDLSDLIRNKVKKNSSFDADVMPRYYLNSEGLGELLQKVYIPQRDTEQGCLKK